MALKNVKSIVKDIVVAISKIPLDTNNEYHYVSISSKTFRKISGRKRIRIELLNSIVYSLQRKNIIFNIKGDKYILTVKNIHFKKKVIDYNNLV